MRILFTITLMLLGNIGFSQVKPTIVKDSLDSEHFINVIEQTIESYFLEYANTNQYDSILKAFNYTNSEYAPEFSDEVYCDRLNQLKKVSSFPYDCNTHTLSTIKFFAKNRRSFAKIVLGRSSIYFDMYEQMLDKYGLPTELKYLSVIESGLRPQVKSPAGALGLWQFMYGTGKMYGLKENSYIDERMDPLKSTDAACRYLKKLFDIYNDWNLALAAYNAGPGNVNKAIRRAGGKTTYWEVRPFLPRETQGYVPNFVAASYLLTYHLEHNIKPAPVKQTFNQLDTICFNQGIHMNTISELIDWDLNEISALNPVYKTKFIPQSNKENCLTGPISKIGKLISLEDSLYTLEEEKYSPKPAVTVEPQIEKTDSVSASVSKEVLKTEVITKKTYIYHKVRSGETLSKIANKYNVSGQEILVENRLRSSRLQAGRTLKIPKTVTINNSVKDTKEATNTLVKTTEKSALQKDTTIEIYHIVKRNESLTIIANQYNTTVDLIKEWNNLQSNWLNIDQKLKIKHTLKPNVSSQLLDTQNKTIEPKVENPTQVVTPVKVNPTMYTIRQGDLFNKIAIKHGLTLQELKKLNPNINPDRISVGQKIRVK